MRETMILSNGSCFKFIQILCFLIVFWFHFWSIFLRIFILGGSFFEFEGINTSMGIRVAFHDRRTDGLLCVLAFVLFASTFSRRIVSVSNKMQYFNVTPPDERA